MSSHLVADNATDGLDVEDAKQALRSAAREMRARRSAHAREELGKAWVETIMGFIGESETVSAYVSVNAEPPTRLLCDAIVNSGKKLLLPKLGPGLAREWAYYRGAEDLQVLAPGRPPEPGGEPISSEALEAVEVLIIPALLVSHDGTRLGQGGGWYDRILKQVGPNARVGAMVYEDEFIEETLPQDENDMLVGNVILPHEVVALPYSP